jgi:hypothetical protein
MTPNKPRARLHDTFGVLLACLLLGGCITQWHYDLGEHMDAVAMPLPSKGTSLADTLVMLGPPHRMSASETGYLLAWEHWHVRETNVGFSLGAAGADFMSADWGRMRAKGEFILLTFDRDNTLTAAARSDWDSNRGGGQAVQPFFSFVSVVDADDLVRRMHQHRWGMGLLQRPTEALNRDSSPYSGQAGIEQRGTPRGAGQQTLELD